MKINKLVLLGVFLIGFLFSWFDFGQCEEEFPEWVPKEAIDYARYQIKLTAEFRNEIGSMYSDEPSKFRMDSTKCTLKFPVEVVQVDYLNYSKGCDIKELFFDDIVYFRAPFEEYYAFSFYQGDSCLGHMNIFYCKGKWMGDDSNELQLKKDGRDLLGEISNEYPWRDGYRIYYVLPYRRHIFYPEFYIEKNGEIIKIIGYVEDGKRIVGYVNKDGKHIDGYLEDDIWLELPIERRLSRQKERTESKYKTNDIIKKRYGSYTSEKDKVKLHRVD